MISLGAGRLTDALFAGMAVPQLMLTVVSGSLTHVLIPLLAGEDAQRQRHDAWAFLILVAGGFAVVAALLFVLAPLWVALLLPGFDPAGRVLAVELSRIQLVGMVFTAITGVQAALYNARSSFMWPELAQALVGGLGFVLLVWLLPVGGVHAAAWVMTLRFALQALLLAPVMGRPVWPDLSAPVIRAAWQRIRPLLLGTTYYKTDPLVDRYLLSSAGSGSLSLYYLAQQLFSAAIQVLGKALVLPVVPALSRLAKAGDDAAFHRLWQKSMLLSGIFVAISLAGLLLIGQPVLGWLVGHGSVTAANVNDLWWMMLWLAGFFAGSVLGQIAASSFYAQGNTRTPTRISMLSYSFYIPAKVVGYCWGGVAGLALVTSAYYLLNLFLQARILLKSAQSYCS